MSLDWYEEQMSLVFGLARSLVGMEVPIACVISLNIDYPEEFLLELQKNNYDKMRGDLTDELPDTEAWYNNRNENINRILGDKNLFPINPSQSGRIVAFGLNRVEEERNPTSHAEINALSSFYERFSRYQAKYFDIFVNLEPCLMCTGALLLAGFKTVVFANFAQKTGGLLSLLDAESLVRSSGGIYRPIDIIGGVCESEGLEILRSSIR